MLIDGTTLSMVARRVACTATVAATLLFGTAAAQAYQTTSGWVASDYATGFTPGSGDGAGPVGLAFDGSGNLLVAATGTDSLHKVAPGGGTASATKIHDGYGDVGGLAFDKSGRLYLARGTQHDVVELNPASGEVLRTVVTNLPCPVGLATDPISGDLFVSNVFCKGGGIKRIRNFGTGPGVAETYAGTQDADGLTFAPDGTLYAAGGTKLVRISGTNSSSPGAVTTVVDIPNIDGIVYAPATDRDDTYLVVVRTDGQIDRVDLNGTITPVLTGASRGDLVTVGPDRCIYADLQDRVVKLGPTTGSCNFSAPVQPSFPDSGDAGGVLGENAAQRVVDTGVKATAPKTTKRGSRFTLTLKVANNSDTAAHTVILTDKLPRGTKFVSARSVAGVSCKPKKSTVTCRKSSLAAHKSFKVKVVVRSKTGSTYTNNATVKSNDLDPAPGNNRSKSKTKVKGRTSVLGVQRRGARLPRTTG